MAPYFGDLEVIGQALQGLGDLDDFVVGHPRAPESEDECLVPVAGEEEVGRLRCLAYVVESNHRVIPPV